MKNNLRTLEAYEAILSKAKGLGVRVLEVKLEGIEVKAEFMPSAPAKRNESEEKKEQEALTYHSS